MEGQGDIYRLIPAIMAEISAIGKNQKNQQQGFQFRGIDDVYNALHPLMAKHKVFTVPEVLSEVHEERKTKSGSALLYRLYKIRYTFCAPDGSSVAATVIGEGMDSGDKAGNKAMAIAHKYALLQMFCIPTEDTPDPDAQSHTVEPKGKPTPAPSAQKATAKNFKFLENMSTSKSKILDLTGSDELYYGILSAHEFNKSNEIIERKDQVAVWQDMQKEIKRLEAALENKEEPDAFPE